MSLKKQDVCVFIENEQQLQEAMELLEMYKQEVDEVLLFLSDPLINYLQCVDNNEGWWLAKDYTYSGKELNKITLPELEQILKDQA